MQQPDQNGIRTIGNKKGKARQLTAAFCIASALITPVLLPSQAQARDPAPDYATLVEQQAKVVVKITARKSSTNSRRSSADGLQQLPEQLRKYFEQLPQNPGLPHSSPGQPSSGFGSGFIISSDGVIVTNHHVIENADDIEVSLQNRKSYSATLLGSDPRTDLAVLKIDAEDLPVASFGETASLKVGQWVLAIGSPFGFDYTATQGIISALSRSLPSNDSNYVPFIQTDVAVNPGNSGGPLFDLQGRVVGVNSQIYTRSGGYMGLSFAIPVDVVKNVVAQLRETGQVSRGWLGVSIQEVDRDLAESFGMDRPTGALVAAVSDDSPAAAAGFEPGDIILSFDGKPVPSSSTLPAIVGSTKIDTQVEVQVLRAGAETTLAVTVGKLDEKADNRGGNQRPSKAIAGMTLLAINKEMQEQTGLRSGLQVESLKPGSAAAKSGLQKGDVLISLNRKPLDTVEDFRVGYAAADADKPMPLLVARGDRRLYLPLSKQD